MKQLGNRLRTLREGLGISQAKFAEIIGSTQLNIAVELNTSAVLN